VARRLILALRSWRWYVGVALVARRMPNTRATPATIEPVSVSSRTSKPGERPAFDGALEQPLGRLPRGRVVITRILGAMRYGSPRRSRAAADSTMPPARLVAFREASKYVLAGPCRRSRRLFSLEVNAIDPTTEPSSAPRHRRREASRTYSLRLEPSLQVCVSDWATSAGSRKRAAAETFTAGSLEAFREYAAAQDLAQCGRDEEAVAHYRRAVAFDPAFDAHTRAGGEHAASRSSGGSRQHPGKRRSR